MIQIKCHMLKMGRHVWHHGSHVSYAFNIIMRHFCHIFDKNKVLWNFFLILQTVPVHVSCSRLISHMIFIFICMFVMYLSYVTCLAVQQPEED